MSKSKEYICKNMNFEKDNPYPCSSCSGAEPHQNDAINTLSELCAEYEYEELVSERSSYTENQKERVCSIVQKWMIEHNCHSGEHAGQNDACNIDAINIVCDLADVVGVENEYS